MIRRLFVAIQSVTCAAVLLHTAGAAAASALQDFPRAGVQAAGGTVLASAAPAEGGPTLQLAALDASIYGSQGAAATSSYAGNPAGGTADTPERAAALPAEGLPLLAGLACIAAFVLRRRTRL